MMFYSYSCTHYGNSGRQRVNECNVTYTCSYFQILFSTSNTLLTRSDECRGSLIQALLQVDGGPTTPEVHSRQPSSPATTPTTTTSGDQKARYDDKSSPKAFVCPECGKQFNAHYNLTRHMPVHTGARPFVCKVRQN